MGDIDQKTHFLIPFTTTITPGALAVPVPGATLFPAASYKGYIGGQMRQISGASCFFSQPGTTSAQSPNLAVPTSTDLAWEGPARMYLTAGVSPAVVSGMLRLSANYSAFP